MKQTVQSLYENFINEHRGRLNEVAGEVFAFSSDDILVIANSNRLMRDIFEMEKANLFAFNKANPKDAKTKHYKFFENKDESSSFYADENLVERFNYGLKYVEHFVVDIASNYTFGGERFVMFTTTPEKMSSFFEALRDMHVCECEIPKDQSPSSIVAGLTITLCTKDSEIPVKNKGRFLLKRDLDKMPQILDEALSKAKEREF